MDYETLIKILCTLYSVLCTTMMMTGTAPGIDGLLNECFKNDVSTKVMVALFNNCLRSHMLPSVWSRGIINPIPKSRDNNPWIPLNYRGISLLPVTSKLYTAAISHRISSFFETSDKIPNVQNGFRENRLCFDHIYSISKFKFKFKNLLFILRLV